MADYVVIGGGSAGAVVASRLSEDAGCSVTLLEAGEATRDLRVRAPGLAGALWRTRFDWGYRTEPQAELDGRRVYWPRGRALGGTSAINYLVYIRGHRDDYDAWRDAGNPGWGYQDVLPSFKRSERNARGADAYHGGDGPLWVGSIPRITPVVERLCDATSEVCGVARTDDFNGPEQEGAGPYQVTCRDGQRWSTADAFLLPVMSRENLDVVTGALVERIVFEGRRAVAVRYRKGGRVHEVRAEREIILSAGAVGSPQILMRSGVGPPDHLRGLGIDVVAPLDGVGENLQDHFIGGVAFEALGRSAPNFRKLRMLGWVAQYLAGRRGFLTSNVAEGGAFVRSTASAPRPDLQLLFLPCGPASPNTDERNYEPEGRAFMIVAALLRPASRGRIRLKSADPTAHPLIDPRYLTEPADLELMLEGGRLGREIAGARAMRGVVGRPLLASSSATADRATELADLRERGNTVFHPAGTCRMGTDALAVVDPTLRVHGVEALRVADASIMPTLVGGNTNAPCIMIGERAADLVRATS